MEDLRYPIGRFEAPAKATSEDRRVWIGQIAAAPARMQEAVAGLTAEQIETPYRPGGWTARQVVHHLADSHINSYVRFRLALTEDEPAVKGYDENLWAQLDDARCAPVELSLALLDALHARWVLLLGSLGEGSGGARSATARSGSSRSRGTWRSTPGTGGITPRTL